MKSLSLIAAVSVLAGCLAVEPAPTTTSSSVFSTPTTSPYGTPSPTPTADASPKTGQTLFVILNETYFANRTSGSGSVYGNVGHHCGQVVYTFSPPRLNITNYGSGNPAPPTGGLVRKYSPGQSGMPVASTGSAPVFYGFDRPAGDVSLASAFDSKTTVARLMSTSSEVRINGTVLAQGSPVVKRFEADVRAGDSMFHVTEILRFGLVGEAASRSETTGGYCI